MCSGIKFFITDSNGLGRFRLHYFRVLGRFLIGTLWTDMWWNGGEGNSLLAQVLRNQVSLSLSEQVAQTRASAAGFGPKMGHTQLHIT